MEGHDHKKFLLGELTSESYSFKLSQLELYMQTLLIEYEMLRNDKVKHVGLDLFKNTWNNVDFSTLPVIGQNYHEKRRLYNSNSVELLCNFVLTSVCESLLVLYTSTVHTDAARAFVVYFMDKLWLSEKAISDPGLLRGKSVPLDDEQGDALDVEIDITDAIDGDFDPFSLESTGIDSSQLEDNGSATES
jgi:hypothetical protein